MGEAAGRSVRRWNGGARTNLAGRTRTSASSPASSSDRSPYAKFTLAGAHFPRYSMYHDTRCFIKSAKRKRGSYPAYWYSYWLSPSHDTPWVGPRPAAVEGPRSESAGYHAAARPRGSGMVTFAPGASAAVQPPVAGPLTYRGYLCLDTLLRCQRPITSEPAELLFIIFHQASELWFAGELDALDRARDAMLAGKVDPALDALQLAADITRKLTVSLGWLDDHLSPQAFAKFRGALGTASTLQSLQFREIEYLSGLKDNRFLSLKGLASADRDRLAQRLAEPSLWDAFCAALAEHGLPNAGPGLTATLNLLSSPGPYPSLYELAEALIDHDQAWADWRARHARMVARHLGAQSGTAGTSGASYLRARVAVEFFPQLWAARLHRPREHT